MAAVISAGIYSGSNQLLYNAERSQRVHRLPSYIYTQTVTFEDFTDTDTSEELDLNATFTSNVFPTQAFMGIAWIQRVTDFAGGTVSACTIAIGDTGDPNGLVTAIDIFTGAKATAEITATEGAAEFNVGAFESAFAPTATITTTGQNIDDLTAGEFRVCIEYRPIRAF